MPQHSRKNTEEVIREYEQCLEKVLTWLLEAEHELQTMDALKTDENLETVKRQFREHELFMRSLTESQESIGRVLLRYYLKFKLFE